jgi:hypothetical protein
MIRAALGAERVTVFIALRVADKVIECPRVRDASHSGTLDVASV